MASQTYHFEPQMNVADVRKCLTQVRRAWDLHSPETPICLCTPLHNEMRMDEFCFAFVMGHHAKRHSKSKR